MSERFARTELLLGEAGVARLAAARVAVFGVGGVGGAVVEALARAGVGTLDLVDSDTVSVSNINRQILATTATVGQYKVEVAAARVREINPDAAVHTYPVFFTPETAADFDFAAFDYVVDAVDTVSAKIALVLAAEAAGTPIICAMGAGNKLDPTAFRVADIYKTAVDPLARVMRTELRRRGVRKLKVVYSEEPPRTPAEAAETDKIPGRRTVPGSVSFVPPAMGLALAGEVVKDLLGIPPRA